MKFKRFGQTGGRGQIDDRGLEVCTRHSGYRLDDHEQSIDPSVQKQLLLLWLGRGERVTEHARDTLGFLQRVFGLTERRLGLLDPDDHGVVVLISVRRFECKQRSCCQFIPATGGLQRRFGVRYGCVRRTVGQT